MITRPVNCTAFPLEPRPRGQRSGQRGWQRRLMALTTPQNAIALITIVLSLLMMVHLQHTQLFTEDGLQQVIDRTGYLAPLLYILLVALTVVVSHLPGLPLVSVAGMVWGGTLGGLYSLIGGFLGSLLAYSLGRTLGNSAMKVLTGKQLTLTTHRSQRFIGWLIFTTRLLPVFPFDLISYGAGITRLPLPIYATATLFGMAPPTFAIAFMGKTMMQDFPFAIMVWLLLGVSLGGISWGIQRHNWFGLREMFRLHR